MNLAHNEEEERRSSQRVLAEARDAIAKEAARSKENKEIVAAMARSINLENASDATPSEALRRAVAAQLEVVEEIGDKVKSAATPQEAQEWQIVQRNAFQDLRAAEEAAQEYEVRQTQFSQNHVTEQFLTVGGVTLGVTAIIVGAVVSLIGHPLIGAPIAGGGVAWIKQALGKSKGNKSVDKND